MLLAIDWTLPLKNPVLIFSLVLFVILFAPIVLQKLRIPGIIGLILAGVAIGPNGFGILLRDASIELFGTVGLLYIMMMVGLEVDLQDFKKNKNKSLIFGLFTFIIPLVFGYLAGRYVLAFSQVSSILFGVLLAPHTMLAYPIASRYGVSKLLPVNITVGGTIITDTVALVLLAVTAGTTTGEVGAGFWIQLAVSVILFGVLVFGLFPRIGLWFFKRVEDNVSQYIFVLAMTFLGAFIAELAGLEAIIGAFMAGLALNRLIPHTSPLMHRLEFVGNALFIPFFLIGVGMLVDLKLLLNGYTSLLVAGTMTVAAVLSKWLAAWAAQLAFKMNKYDRRLIFGLSVSRAAATLAAVLVGFKLNLLTEEVFNGAILMILVTCLVGSFVVERAARKLAIIEANNAPAQEQQLSHRILVPLSNPETVASLIDFAIFIKPTGNKTPVFGLSVVREDDADGNEMNRGKKLLEQAAKYAAGTDSKMELLSRVDVNITNGIVFTAKEQNISDIVIGWNPNPQVTDKLFGGLMTHLLRRTDQTVVAIRSFQPLNTIRRVLVVVPENGEVEPGFMGWLELVRHLAKQTDAELVFYGSQKLEQRLLGLLKNKKTTFVYKFEERIDWEGFLRLEKAVLPNDLLLVISARKGTLSHTTGLDKAPAQLSNVFNKNSFAILFPEIKGYSDRASNLQLDPSMRTPIQENIERIAKVGKFVKKAFGTGEQP